MPTPTPVSPKPPHIREITPRSVTVGLLVALVIGASYPYVVLKFGFGPNISVVSKAPNMKMLQANENLAKCRVSNSL